MDCAYVHACVVLQFQNNYVTCLLAVAKFLKKNGVVVESKVLEYLSRQSTLLRRGNIISVEYHQTAEKRVALQAMAVMTTPGILCRIQNRLQGLKAQPTPTPRTVTKVLAMLGARLYARIPVRTETLRIATWREFERFELRSQNTFLMLPQHKTAKSHGSAALSLDDPEVSLCVYKAEFIHTL